MNREELRSFLCERSEDIVLLEPDFLDEAIIGISDTDQLIYSYEKLIEAFVKGNEGWSEEDAIEWIDCNTLRTLPYCGEHKPIIQYNIEE